MMRRRLAFVALLTSLGVLLVPHDVVVSGPAPPDTAPERRRVYHDDMENGRFDLFFPAFDIDPLNGGFEVLDDGSGNSVARLTDDMHLVPSGAASPALTWDNYEMMVRAKRGPNGKVSFGFRINGPEVIGNPKGYWLNSEPGDDWTLSRVRLPTEPETPLASFSFPTPVDTWFVLGIQVQTVGRGVQIDAWLDATPLLSYYDDYALLPVGGVRFRTEDQGSGAELVLDDLEVFLETDSRYTWSQTKGPLNGWMSDVAVDPNDWRTAYAAGWDGGLYKTTDGGHTWGDTGLSHALWDVRTRNVEIAPSNSQVVYVGTNGKGVNPLWRSDDGGDTWRWTSAADIDNGKYRLSGDVYAIAVHPTDPMHIFVGLGEEGVFESTNGGSDLGQLGPIWEKIETIAIDPDFDQTGIILAAPYDPGEKGTIWRSPDYGQTWVSIEHPDFPHEPGETVGVRQFLFYPPNPSVVFALTWRRVIDEVPTSLGPLYRSGDGGSTWLPVESAGLPAIEALRYTDGMLLGFRSNEVVASFDAGENWVRRALIPNVGGIAGADVSADNPNAIYIAGRRQGMIISEDRGETWRPSGVGLKVQPINSLAIDPNDPATAYAGGMDGLYKTMDQGESWDKIVPLGDGHGLHIAVAVDPNDSEVVYRSVGVVPEAERGLFRSRDGGITWPEDITGEIPYDVSTIVIAPDTSTIYAGTGGGPQNGPQGAGLWRSTDYGGSWSQVALGASTPDFAVPAIEIDSTGERVAVATMGDGVYVSEDGGNNFQQRGSAGMNGFSSALLSNYVYALAMSPDNPDIMYAGTNNHYANIGGTVALDGADNAVYKTVDGGQSWEPVLQSIRKSDPWDLPYIRFGGGADDITIVPGHPGWVYVAMHNPGVVFTGDGGASWRYANEGMIPVLTHIYAYRMEITSDGEFMYSGGCGRSVFVNRVKAVEPGYTPMGTSVAVWVGKGVTVTFDNVIEAGMTTVTNVGTGKPLLAGYRLGDPSAEYEISTTASFTGNAEVCINYDETAFDSEADLRLLHWQDGDWVDATSLLDTSANRICAVVTNLSPFALAEPGVGVGGIAALPEIGGAPSEMPDPSSVGGGWLGPSVGGLAAVAVALALAASAWYVRRRWQNR